MTMKPIEPKAASRLAIVWARKPSHTKEIYAVAIRGSQFFLTGVVVLGMQTLGQNCIIAGISSE
jgi:hypothetical protein